jgi:hypothetical protein
MAIKDIGPLLGADEGLNHQAVDTSATLSPQARVVEGRAARRR